MRRARPAYPAAREPSPPRRIERFCPVQTAGKSPCCLNFWFVALRHMPKPEKPRTYYDEIKQKFAEERDLRVARRPEGRAQYVSDFDSALERYAVDPFSGEVAPRAPISDQVEVLFIGGGFSALL